MAPVDQQPLLINGTAADGDDGDGDDDDLLLEGDWPSSKARGALIRPRGSGKEGGGEDFVEEEATGVMFDKGLKRRAVFIIAVLVGCNVALIAALFILGSKTMYPGV